MTFVDLLPALGFFLLNVFVPGPNVLNTIATSTGSGYRAGLACALACGLGILLWASAALFGAAAFFETYPFATQSLIVLGGSLLIYFAVRYLRKAINPQSDLVSIHAQTFASAFWQAFVVMMTNPKVLTTWLAVISLFPIITDGVPNILEFILLSAAASFSGHALFASFFSSRTAAAIYLSLYRPLNGLVGIGFFFYGIKLLSGAFL